MDFYENNSVHSPCHDGKAFGGKNMKYYYIASFLASSLEQAFSSLIQASYSLEQSDLKIFAGAKNLSELKVPVEEYKAHSSDGFPFPSIVCNENFFSYATACGKNRVSITRVLNEYLSSWTVETGSPPETSSSLARMRELGMEVCIICSKSEYYSSYYI